MFGEMGMSRRPGSDASRSVRRITPAWFHINNLRLFHLQLARLEFERQPAPRKANGPGSRLRGSVYHPGVKIWKFEVTRFRHRYFIKNLFLAEKLRRLERWFFAKT